MFEKTCQRLRGENEAIVIYYITQPIVPSAVALAIRGAKHLEILRETVNAGWINAIPFYGPRPQPDYSLGFDREAFTEEQLRKLQPFTRDELEDCSYIAATYNMYLPFLTSEVNTSTLAVARSPKSPQPNRLFAWFGRAVPACRPLGRASSRNQRLFDLS